MHALVFDGQLRLVHDHPEPVLKQGEALIRPHLVGVCNTDVEITRGYKGFQGILGHEFVGTVIACEDARWIGSRVVGEINAACFRCDWCMRGESSHCPNRTTLGIFQRNGAMAELLSLPTACLHTVPESVPDQAAVFTEPLAAALEILEQSHIRPTERVAVVGDGKLGLLCAQVLRLPGAMVVVVGRHPERWDLLNGLGIQTVHANDLADGDSNGSHQHALFGTFDAVVDCTGNALGITTARRLVRPRGRLVLKSTFHGDTFFDLSRVVVDEIQLLGSRCGPFAPALRLLERQLIVTEPLIAARFLLQDAAEAFHAAHGQLKILLEV